MKILAPLILLAGLSAALYKTQEVWPKSEFDLQAKGVHPEVVRDVGQLQAAMKGGKLTGMQAEAAFKGKYGQGSGGLSTIR